jgi:16S rRNA (guanine527-N7)-methyltransferase
MSAQPVNLPSDLPQRAQRPPRAAPDLTADRARALELTPVSRETLARLDRFVELLLETQSHTNLVGPKTVAELWTRHIADSLQLLDLAPDALIWLDLGSGAGFPGLVIACALADRPGAAVHLVESTTKKAVFLRHVVDALGLPAIVHHGRIEDLSPAVAADVITARALAPLDQLLGYVAPVLKPGAKALLPKGQDIEAELTEAAKYWKLEVEFSASRTSPAGRILVLRGLRRRAGKKISGPRRPE